MKSISYLFITVCLFFTNIAFSQIYLQDLNLNEVEGVTFIEVNIRGSFSTAISSLAYRINVDYGQTPYNGIMRGEESPVTILDKPGGDIIDFQSKMHVINYFENNGWSLWDVNSESRGDTQAKTSYYFKKK